MYPEGVSLIICTFNGASRLPETLQHAIRQDVDKDIKWEIIVVDNASTDNSVEIAAEIFDSHDYCSIIHEPESGLSFARKAGIKKAQYEFISFIDDDNRIASDWVQTVSNIFTGNCGIGMCGGLNTGVFEITPPVWFDKIRSAFAVGEQAPETMDVTETRGYLWGAGLSFRKSVYDLIRHYGYDPFLTDRKGKELTSGEDSELAFAFRIAGYRLWYFRELKLDHWMPSTRFKWDHVSAMFRGFGASQFIFDIYHLVLHDKRRWEGKLYIYVTAVIYLIISFLLWSILSFCTREGNPRYLTVQVRKKYIITAYKSLFKFTEIFNRIKQFKIIVNQYSGK